MYGAHVSKVGANRYALMSAHCLLIVLLVQLYTNSHPAQTFNYDLRAPPVGRVLGIAVGSFTALFSQSAFILLVGTDVSSLFLSVTEMQLP